MVVVVGTGGFGVRRFGKEVNNPWWASAQAYETGLITGALICKFNENGMDDRAHCKFTSPYGPKGPTVLDEFWLRSEVGNEGAVGAEDSSGGDRPSFLRLQVSSSGDDVVQTTGRMYCDSTSADLGTGLTRTGLTPVKAAFRFQDVPLRAADSDHLIAAYISMSINANSRNGSPARFQIRAEMTADAQPLCTSAALEGRNWSQTVVEWVDVQPWDGRDENYMPGMQVETPNLLPLLRNLLRQPGWSEGNSISFSIDGDGTRSVRTFDLEEGCHAPALVVAVRNRCEGAETQVATFFPAYYLSVSYFLPSLFLPPA
jgi:hypothetical protein